MSEYTKIFRPSKGACQAMAQIHANHYGSSLDHINDMADVLKEDFGKNVDIKVHKYGGKRLKGITFVEVQVGFMKRAPEGYEEI